MRKCRGLFCLETAVGRPRKVDRFLPAGLYVKHGKTADTYFTIINNKYVGLGGERQKAESQLRSLLAGSPIPDSLSSLVEKFIAHLERDFERQARESLSRRTIDDYTDALRNRFVPIYGHMKLSSFKPRHAAQYLARPENEDRKVRANRELAALGSCFAYGMRLGVIDANPCHGVRRNKEFSRNRRVEVAELNRFIEIADAKGPGYFMTALIGTFTAMTGRRRAEILTLRKSDIHAGGVFAKEAKSKPGEVAREFEIAWSPTLREIVDKAMARELPKGVTSMYVFPTRTGTPYTDQGFKGMWNRIMHDFANDGGEWFTAHDLRAFYVTEMLAEGRNPNTHRNEQTMRKVYDRRKRVKVAPLR